MDINPQPSPNLAPVPREFTAAFIVCLQSIRRAPDRARASGGGRTGEFNREIAERDCAPADDVYDRVGVTGERSNAGLR
jgi:hypothetical protein